MLCTTRHAAAVAGEPTAGETFMRVQQCWGPRVSKVFGFGVVSSQRPWGLEQLRVVSSSAAEQHMVCSYACAGGRWQVCKHACGDAGICQQLFNSFTKREPQSLLTVKMSCADQRAVRKQATKSCTPAVPNRIKFSP